MTFLVEWNLDKAIMKLSKTFALYNLFVANVLILHPLKTPENLWFSGVFKECKMGTLAANGLIKNI